MYESINFDINITNHYLKKREWILLAEYYELQFKVVKDSNGTPKMFEFSEEILEHFRYALNILTTLVFDRDVKILCTELFRALRNYVVNSEVQNYLIENDIFLIDTKCITEKLLTEEPKDSSTLKILLQFLINLIVKCEGGTVKICELFLKEITIMLKGNICIYEASALVYNISVFKSLELYSNLFEIVLDLYEKDNTIIFLHFLLESFLEHMHFWSNYPSFKVEHRLIILEIIKDNQIKTNQSINLHEDCIIVFINHFLNSNNIIFQTASNNDQHLEAYEVSHILDILASCTEKNLLKLMQKDKNFLIAVGVVLINIHRLGKQSENNFSAIQKLSDIRQPNDKITAHPAFGFKVSLIRVVGNLCWKNKYQQDLVREAELIPVLLDCCNMDARNPLIIQWVIMAIRNLCENNFENQTVIGNLQQQNTVSSTVLEEMGITLNTDSNNPIKIVPFESINK